ncbi:hypothetical protein EAF00_009296 [Botryotinia globosa]|nr:hypothetical protein EAF00_009296 [Botryotinia globosa]
MPGVLTRLFFFSNSQTPVLKFITIIPSLLDVILKFLGQHNLLISKFYKHESLFQLSTHDASGSVGLGIAMTDNDEGKGGQSRVFRVEGGI